MVSGSDIVPVVSDFKGEGLVFVSDVSVHKNYTNVSQFECALALVGLSLDPPPPPNSDWIIHLVPNKPNVHITQTKRDSPLRGCSGLEPA